MYIVTPYTQYKANTAEAVQEATKGEKELGEYLETDDESCNYPFPPISWGSSSSLGECCFVCTLVSDQRE